MLVALAWPNHVHHGRAYQWFYANSGAGWATCPLTQVGFVRLSSNPGFIKPAVTPREAARLLQQLTQVGRHEFWQDDLDVTVSGALPLELATGHHQITDAYLLGLAIKRNGRLATLDKSIGHLLPANSPHQGVIELIEP